MEQPIYPETAEQKFLRYYELTLNFYKKNKKVFDGLFILIIIALIGAGLYYNNQRRKEKELENLIGKFYVYIYKGDKENALAIGNQMLNKYLGDKKALNVFYLMANIYANDFKREESIAILEKVKNNYKDDNDIYMFVLSKLAYLYTYNNSKKAENLFSYLIEKHPKAALSNYWRLELAKLIYKDNPQKAIELCNYVINNELQNPQLKQEAKNLKSIYEYVSK